MRSLDDIAQTLEPHAKAIPPEMFMLAMKVAAESGYGGVLNWLIELEQRLASSFDSARFVPPSKAASVEIRFLWALRCATGMEVLGILRSSEVYESAPSPCPWHGNVDLFWFVGPVWNNQRRTALREWAFHFSDAARQHAPQSTISPKVSSN